MLTLAILTTVSTASVLWACYEVRRAPLGSEGREGFSLGRREQGTYTRRAMTAQVGKESCSGAEVNRSRVKVVAGMADAGARM